jgi:SAM-dependent methyltransferase
MSDSVDVPHSRENAVRFFKDYITQNKDFIKGKKVYDLSAGSGYIISLFEEAGANVKVFDLFPDQNKFTKALCEKLDLQQKFPIGDSSADIIICSETIEHLPNQFFFFGEVARILKHNGSFILTTPNSSSLRSRFSQFLMESEHYSAPAPNELNAFTPWEGNKDGYFSKLFISGVLRLRTLAALHKLKIKTIHKTQRSSTSYWLLIFYPFIYYFNKKNLKKQIQADPSNTKTYQEIFETNTSSNVLLGKHLILEFEKSFA